MSLSRNSLRLSQSFEATAWCLWIVSHYNYPESTTNKTKLEHPRRPRRSKRSNRALVCVCLVFVVVVSCNSNECTVSNSSGSTAKTVQIGHEKALSLFRIFRMPANPQYTSPVTPAMPPPPKPPATPPPKPPAASTGLQTKVNTTVGAFSMAVPTSPEDR